MTRRLAKFLCASFVATLGGIGAPGVDAVANSLPSPAGPTISSIKKMPAGSWRNLGAPRPDPDWGRARGRAWTSKMAYSKILSGAFLYGEGVHGWANPSNGRYMDGLWLYDVNGHRWVNMYPGTDTRTPPKLVVTGEGVEGTAPDRPIPIATMVHGYEMTAWDPDRQLFFSMPNTHTYYRNVLPGVAGFRKENQQRLNRNRVSPWMFDPWHRKWDRVRTLTASPRSSLGHALMYIPSKRAHLFYDTKQIHFYDPDALKWTRTSPTGPRPPFGIDAAACHDPRRDRVYIGGGAYPVAPGPNALWYYDVGANRWVDPRPGGDPGGKSYSNNVSIMLCDTNTDRIYLFRHRGNSRGLYIYHPRDNRWRKDPAPLPRFWLKSRMANGFFHPELGVHFFHVAHDSKDDGRIIVYKPPAR